MILSSSPNVEADIRIKRRRPPAKPKFDGKIRLSVSLKVDTELWELNYGPPGSVEEDVKSHILTNLQAGYEGSEGLWKDVDVK
jgi:hypothetical protein